MASQKLSTQVENIISSVTKEAISSLSEEKIMMTTPKPYTQKTENLSAATKQAHDNLYRRYIEDFNKVQLELQTASRTQNYLVYRSLQQNKTFLLNAIKLHELYFSNTSDLSSELSVNSLAYSKLVECFGSFDAWQEDFIACCLVAREGWAITYFDPYLKTYTNCVIDLHEQSIPLGCVPLIVMDMWSHAYFHDYGTDKKAYVYNIMKELNWTVIEGRFQNSNNDISSVFGLRPTINSVSQNTIVIPTSINYEELPINTSLSGNKDPLAQVAIPKDTIFEDSVTVLNSNLKKIFKEGKK